MNSIFATQYALHWGETDQCINVDLFAGGGGDSTGIEIGLGRPVHLAINHSPAAISMHEANHPGALHLQTDVWEIEMNDKYKLVPVEPTQEMINAALKSDHAEISPRKIVEQDYKAMLAAAPAVQVEPIGWYTEDHFDDKSATTYSAEVAQRWRDKGWPVWPLYTTPQPDAKGTTQ